MIRWGILGCGDVTEQKSGPAFQKCRGSALQAVMRRTPGAAEDYARRHGVPAWYDSVEGLLADPEVDAVYVATPPGCHMDQALQVCESGRPCYVEKPMARHYPECLRMLRAYERAGLPLFVAYYRRAQPQFVRAREWIRAGMLGEIESVRYRYQNDQRPAPEGRGLPWRYRPEVAGGGLFLDLASHTLDILDFLLGPLEVTGSTVERVCPAYAVEDRVAMTFRAGGARGKASWDFTQAPRMDDMTIAGSRGCLTLSTFGRDPFILDHAEGRETFAPPALEHVQYPYIQTVVDSLEGRGACPGSAESAARTSRVMDEVLADFYGGREDAFWERMPR